MACLGGFLSLGLLGLLPYVGFFLVYFLCIVTAWPTSMAFTVNGEDVLALFANIYFVSKTLTAYVPLHFLQVSSGLINKFVLSVQGELVHRYRTIWLLALAVATYQCALLIAGAMLFVGKQESVVGLLSLYPFVWALNAPRYVLHFVCVRVFSNHLSQAVATNPVCAAIREALVYENRGLLIVSMLTIFSPLCSFSVTLATAIRGLASMGICCTACCIDLDDRDRNDYCGCCLLVLFVSTVLYWLATAVEWVNTHLLTFVAKYNLTVMSLLEMQYTTVVRKTYEEKKRSERSHGIATIVTENISSSHITNLCVLCGLLVYLSVGAIEPKAAFYGLFAGYCICRTMLEPADAWILLGFALWEHHPGLLHVMGGKQDFKEAFEEMNQGIAAWSKQLNRAKETKQVGGDSSTVEPQGIP